jgi:transcriptional regulator with XRE-family HTH domain
MTPVRLRLRELRTDRGLSQQALADLAGVRQGTVSALELGAKRIDLRTLDLLSVALKVEPGDLFERERKRRGT